MINFFEITCQDKTTDITFGIIDPDEGRATISSLEDKKEWIADVNNPLAKEIVFTAIDQCIKIGRENGEQEKRCDGMLTYDNDVDFVELKKVRQSWIQGGIEQLRMTVFIFSEYNELKKFRKKRAFLANKLRPQFQYSHKEAMQQFKDQTGVRLIITNEIKI